MTVVVGRVDPADASGARDLIVGIQRDEYGFDITEEDQPDLHDDGLFDDDGFYVVGGGGFWVARDGGHVVGTIGLHDCGGGVAVLRKMFVAADHRGPRDDGAPIAERLLDACSWCTLGRWLRVGVPRDDRALRDGPPVLRQAGLHADRTERAPAGLPADGARLPLLCARPRAPLPSSTNPTDAGGDVIPAANILELIGNTPMVDVSSLSPNPNVRILAKLESRTRSAR